MALQLGLNKCSNAEYHSAKEWLSSSSLKSILKSPAKFYADLQEKPTEVENGNFLEGSLLHSMVLEEHQVSKEYAFFTGMRKAGKEFETFKEENPDKTIVSLGQHSRCKTYKKAFEANKTAVNLLKGCETEYSICAELMGVKLKVRFDAINIEQRYGLDLKTSSFGVDHESFKMTMNQFGYGLSAALYSWVAELHYGHPIDFYMVPIGKQDLDCQVYKISQETHSRGRLDIIKAINIYKECLTSGVWPATINLKVNKTVGDYQILKV